MKFATKFKTYIKWLYLKFDENLLKTEKVIIFNCINFSIVPMGAIWYSRPIRPVPTYIRVRVYRRLTTKFHSDSFKTERLVCVETDRRTEGQTDSGQKDRRTDGQTDRRTWLDRLGCWSWSRIYILYIVGGASFNALQTSDWNYNTLQGYKNRGPGIFKKWNGPLARL